MKLVTALIILMTAALHAGEAPVDLGTVNSDDSWLEYDDGTPGWYTWGGTYRGQWFRMNDFYAGTPPGIVEQSRVWFYHEETGHVWDTSDVYIEIWNGGSAGPLTQLDQTLVTAYDYAPAFVTYPSGTFSVETEFWCLVNSELSAGGWPSNLGDDQNGAVAHSFSSDDFLIWEPWSPNGFCYYMIAVDCWPYALEGTSWASLKAAF